MIGEVHCAQRVKYYLCIAGSDPTMIDTMRLIGFTALKEALQTLCRLDFQVHYDRLRLTHRVMIQVLLRPAASTTW